jgi:site-specific DNA-methyltransferase (adenine-specific)
MKINKIYLGDCLQIMKQIDNDSINMVLCDLPYGSTSCKWDIIIDFKKLWEQYLRITKEKSTIVLTASNPFSSLLVNSNIKMFKHELIWEKEQGTGQLNAKKMPLKKHELILVFSKGSIVYNPQKLLNQKAYNKKVNKVPINAINHNENLYNGGVPLNGYTAKNVTSRYPTSIVKFNRELKNRYHPTQKPVTLFEYLIRTYSNKGDLILDNCIGSGTTAIACKKTDRDFIGIEKDEKYFNIANQRIL